MGKSPPPPAAAASRSTESRIRPEFWKHYRLQDLSRAEWEALCDGCAKCCLIKLEDEDTGALAYTDIACRLLDHDSCRCGNYPLRTRLVPGCVMLGRRNLDSVLEWMPGTCAYRLMRDGRPLPDWHPLLTGDPESVHRAGISLRGRMVAEYEVDEEDWPDHVIEEDQP